MIAVLGLLLQVQMGTLIRPETVTVGQHFNATVRVRAPLGAQVHFPSGPDTTSRVDTVSASQQRNTQSSQFTETSINYVLAAWDTGTQSLGLGDVSVVLPSSERLASLRALSVYVRSVLPTDTAQRKPKPPRAIITERVVNWLPWAIVAAVAVLLAVLVWLWRRRRTSAGGALSPLQWAEREFERIEGAGWLEEAEPERYAIAATQVLRGYLFRAVPTLHPSLTTRELAATLGKLPTPPTLPSDRIAGLLETVDPLKFAASRTGREEAARIGADARALVSETDSSIAAAAAVTATAEAEHGPPPRIAA